MKAAKASGAITSFDLNYRAKLWASVSGEAKGQQTIQRIAGSIDALVGNEDDLQKGLGISGPDPSSPRPTGGEGVRGALDPDASFKLIERVVQTYPNIKLVATT